MDRLENGPHARYSRPVSVQEHVLQRGAAHLQPGQRVGLRQRGQHRRRSAGGDDGRHRVAADLVDAVDGRAASTRQRAGLDRDPDRRVEVADQFGRRPELQDLAVVHDRHPVAQRLRLVHVVGGEHHRLAAFVDGPQHIPQVAPGLRVQRRGRLVQEDDLRVVDQRARDGQPLRLAAGEFLGRVSALSVSATSSSISSTRCGRVPYSAAKVGQLFAGGQPLEERRRLQLDADPVAAASGSAARPARPSTVTVPESGLAQALDDLQQGRLAGAVRSENAEELAVPDASVTRRRRRSAVRSVFTTLVATMVSAMTSTLAL